ncbi:hypothetical protein Bealeia2_02001 (plasmid) [Candidatus Bealeia paramacronuclearis]|nr:hypothetical protein [Candidatus Bealeia paramacronuclearis]
MKKAFFKPQFSFRMSLFHSVRDTTPKPLELFYEDRLNMMRDKIKTQILCDTEFFTRPNIVSSSKLLKKEDMNVFSLAVYPEGKTRGREGICGMSGLVLDFDHPDERFQYPEDILKTYFQNPHVQHLRRYWYTTVSSAYRKPRLRVVVPFQDVYSVESFERLYDEFVFLMGNPQGLDHQAGRDCAHVWRVPYVYQVGNSEKECTTRIFQSKVEAGLLECTETQFQNVIDKTSHAWKMFIGSQEELKEDLCEDIPELESPSVSRAAYSREASRVSDMDILNALSRISPDVAYADWIRVGMALHSHYNGSAMGMGLWDNWSQGAPQRYPTIKEIRTHWRSFGKRQSGVSVGTLFYMAGGRDAVRGSYENHNRVTQLTITQQPISEIQPDPETKTTEIQGVADIAPPITAIAITSPEPAPVEIPIVPDSDVSHGPTQELCKPLVAQREESFEITALTEEEISQLPDEVFEGDDRLFEEEIWPALIGQASDETDDDHDPTEDWSKVSVKVPSLTTPQEDAPKTAEEGVVRQNDIISEVESASLLDVITFQDFMKTSADDIPSFLVYEIHAYLKGCLKYQGASYPLAGAIALAGFLLRDLVEGRQGGRTNFLTLTVGPSGTGKSQTLAGVMKILKALSLQKFYTKGLGSMQGCIEHLKQNDGVLFLLQDEASYTVRSSRSRYVMSHELMVEKFKMEMFNTPECYSSDAIKHGEKILLDFPFFAELSLSTPDIFESFTRQDMSKGLLPRYLLFYEAEAVFEKNQSLRKTIPDALADLLQQLEITNSSTRQICTYDEEALALVQRFEKRVEAVQLRLIEAAQEEHAFELSALVARLCEHVEKLSLLTAWHEGAIRPITARGVSWAIAITLQSFETWKTLLRQGLHDTQTEELRAKVLRAIQKIATTQDLSTWITRKAICRKTQYLKPKERDEILHQLSEEECIEMCVRGEKQWLLRLTKKGSLT